MGMHTLRQAGAERIAFTLARRLGGEFRISISTLFDAHLLPEDLRAQVTVGGLRELLFSPADAILTHLFLPGLAARIRGIWDRETPWVHVVHSHGYANLRLGSVKRWLDHHWIFPGADEVVAASDAIAGSMDHIKRLRTIPNAITLKEVAPTAQGPPPTPVVGTVSMLRPEKGLEELVDAAAILEATLPGVKVRVAGEGPLRERLEERIRQKGLEHVLELCGYQEDLQEFYQSLSVYVQPTRNEGFGISALEAFQYNLPMVVARGGFLPTLVGDGAWGLLVDLDGSFPAGLASAVERAFKQREEWVERSGEGLQFWKAKLSVDEMVASYREAIQDATSKR
jgi:glycosyltransferase involved in cell wall biosynthesis